MMRVFNMGGKAGLRNKPMKKMSEEEEENRKEEEIKVRKNK